MPIYSTGTRWNTGHRFTLCVIVFLGLQAAAQPERAIAQTPGFIVDGRGGMSAGGELENYVRYLQALGLAPLSAWSIRPFAPATSDTLVGTPAAHPWRGRGPFQDDPTVKRLTLLPISVVSRENTGYPFGSNDGPVWAGRGLTMSVQTGVAGKFGPVSIVLDPIVFTAANTSFRLQPNGETGRLRFADGDFPTNVDRPQRFGDKRYSAFDPGESTIRIDTHGVTAGITSANEWWGPATTFPVILSNNAAGIPRFFVGTERPTSIGIGTFQIRLEYGIERQSAFSPVTGSKTFTGPDSSGTLRFMSGLITTFSPRGIPGLEIGAARFFHQAWLGSVGRSELLSPFEGLVKNSLPAGVNVAGIGTQDALKNQLASVFFRWVLPHSGVEVYGEYGHEDHNADFRDLESELDHSRIAMAGLRKAFVRSDKKFFAIRGEFFDGYAPTLERHRAEGLIYVHNPIRQGHTEEGQLLGADIGVGSIGGQIIAWDTYSGSGRTTVFVDRKSENNFANFYATGIESPAATDISATTGIERLAFTKWGSVFAAISTTYRGGDHRYAAARGLNVNLQLGATVTHFGI